MKKNLKKWKKWKKWKRLMLLGCMLLGLAGCGKDKTKETKPIQEPSGSRTETSEGHETIGTDTQEPGHEGEVKSFFTGEWIDESLAYVRPVAVMTENTKVALPQYGLSRADVIYECPVEGGISRLMPIYQDYSGMDKIGNVRSCRLYYIYFAKEFDAVYIHAGESKFAVDVLNSSFIDNIDGITAKGGACFFRDNSRKAPHNYYTSSKLIADGLKSFQYSQKLDAGAEAHYQFASEDQPNLLEDGQDAAVVSLYYANPKPWFEYHPEDGKYYRYEFGAAQVDGLTGEQLTATNIIIQNCKSSIKNPKDGTLDIDYRSGGTGLFLTKGKATNITWSRESDNARTRYFDITGEEILLNPGVTWVEIAENGSSGKNKIYSSKEEFH